MKQLTLIVLFFISFCKILPQDNADIQLSKTLLKANLEFLASDYMEGREATTKAENIAAQFLVSELIKYGIKPYFDHDYLQRIPVNVKKLMKDSEVKLINHNGESITLIAGDDWVTQPNDYDKSIGSLQLDLVFAGYGIEAPEYNYNSYEGIDVKDKIVIGLWGEPQSDDEAFFNGQKPTKYYNPQLKMMAAGKRGAKGMILIPDPSLFGYWTFLKRMLMINQVSILTANKEAENSKPIMPGIMVSKEITQKIFEGEEYSYEDVVKMIDKQKIKNFNIMKKMQIYLNTKIWEDEIENVVGIIEGSDPELKKEYIVIGAHYDHEGIWDGVVYNGADDNGSGTVAIMETMRRLSQAGLKRSVIGILFGGEEKGLLGSKFFAENCKIKDNISAMINIDMCGREAVDTLIIKGAQETSKELDDIIKEVDAQMDDISLEVEPGINSPMGTSDHASFAAQGIPVVYFGDKMKVDLHLPSDDVDKINYEKIYRTTKLVENVVKQLDKADHKMSRD